MEDLQRDPARRCGASPRRRSPSSRSRGTHRCGTCRARPNRHACARRPAWDATPSANPSPPDARDTRRVRESVPCGAPMRVHLVDGTFELFRAHFSQRPPKTVALAGGPMDVKATTGLVATMLALLHDPDEAVTHIAIAFDNPIVSFRNDLFDGYKTDEGVLPAIRGPVRSRRGGDARPRHRRVVDGPLGGRRRARHGRDALRARMVEQVRILTPDKDLGQCVQGTRVVQIDRMRRKLIDEDVGARRARRRAGEHPRSPRRSSATPPTGSPGSPASARSRRRRCSHGGARSSASRTTTAQWDVKVTGAPRARRRRSPPSARMRCSTRSSRRSSPTCRCASRSTTSSTAACRARRSTTLCTQLDSKDLRTRPIRFRELTLLRRTTPNTSRNFIDGSRFGSTSARPTRSETVSASPHGHQRP